ncbi:NAD-P-binding protein [Ramaria rubella]|nr:NAD-P-binding protein [Ramaria rubella]
MSVFNSTRLAGKTVLLTGASAGIGKSTALLFAKAGSNVILVARRAEALAAVQQACVAAHKEGGSTSGGQFASVVLDIGDRQAISTLWDSIPSGLRDVDILVNNAGFVFGLDRVGDIANADIDAMFATNVLGLIAMSQLLVRHFKERNAGHIINLGSIAGTEAYPGGSIYCATKHAVNAFNSSLRQELVATPIRVTQISPEFSIVRFRGDKTAADNVYQGLTPLNGDDIAEEIVWAASRPSHVNIAEVLVLPTNQATATLNYRAPKL